MRLIKLNSKGDTLVEVIIALSILTAVLVSSFTLANRSFRVGQQAKERTGATEILQEQAEALRAYRFQEENDPTSSFETFCKDIRNSSILGITPYVIDKQPVTGKWRTSNVSDKDPQNPNRGIYKVYIQTVSTRCGPLFDPQEVTIDIFVEWVRIGTTGATSSEVETTNLRLNLKETSS